MGLIIRRIYREVGSCIARAELSVRVSVHGMQNAPLNRGPASKQLGWFVLHLQLGVSWLLAGKYSTSEPSPVGSELGLWTEWVSGRNQEKGQIKRHAQGCVSGFHQHEERPK